MPDCLPALKDFCRFGNLFDPRSVSSNVDTPSQRSGGSVSKSVWESLVLQLQVEKEQLRLANEELHRIAEELHRIAEELHRMAEELHGVNTQQAAQISTLTAIVTELQARLNKDSHNSSKPPSSDGLKKKPNPKSQRGKSGKRSGGQPGHRGSTLRMNDQADHMVSHSPDACPCGALLTGVPETGFDRRQVFDLPPMKLEVTEHRRLRKTCPCCGRVNQGQFPESVTQPVQYGQRIKGLAVYLTAYQLLPWDRSTQMLDDMFGTSLGEGTLRRALEECKTVVIPIYGQIGATITGARKAGFDETGRHIAGKLHWTHVACTDTLTHYATHPKRGREAIEAIGILPSFLGRAIHDAWSAYAAYPCKHGACNAHNLRELVFIHEEYGQDWAAQFKMMLLDIKTAVDQAKTDSLKALLPEAVAQFEQRYDNLIQQGDTANPKVENSGRRGRTKQTAGYNLLRRLEKREQVLAFLYDFDIPFDNNQAERDLRMVKVKQKISGGFRTLDGAHTFDIIRSYLATMRKQGHNMLRTLETVFQGNATIPSYT
jgi:transposase